MLKRMLRIEFALLAGLSLSCALFAPAASLAWCYVAYAAFLVLLMIIA